MIISLSLGISNNGLWKGLIGFYKKYKSVESVSKLQGDNKRKSQRANKFLEVS